MKRSFGRLAPLAVLLLATPASAQNWHFWQNANLQLTNWQLATGFDYSAGRYGAASDTTVLSIPFTGRVQLGDLRLEATLPYLDVKGPGVFTGGIVVGTGASSTRSGIGDLNLGAAWLLHKDTAEVPAIELEGIVKAPTAESGLGTGKFDYTAQVNLYHSFTPRLMLFGTLGYQWLNNFQTYTLEDGMLASGGVNYWASNDTSVGLSVSYRQEYYGGLGDVFSVSPYLLWDFDENWRISAYGIVGATDASPRYGGGLRLIFAG